MGLRACSVACGLLIVACGGGAGNSGAASNRPPLTTIEVPKNDDEPPAVADDTPSPDRGSGGRGDSLAACVVRLRDAKDVPAGAERQHYDDGRAAEARNDMSLARKSYYNLIQQSPTSKLIPLAYLAFGELFASEAASDPSKWDLARAAYQEVTKYPPPDNSAYAYALLRLADTRRTSDPAQALNEYSKAHEAARQYAALPCAESIRVEARTHTAEVYADVGKPELAYNFFKSREDQNEALEMVARLVERYRRTEKRTDGCIAIRGIPPQLEGSAASSLRAQSAELCAKR